jgi:hypothetical protein
MLIGMAKKPEVTSKRVGSLAGRALSDPSLSKSLKSIVGSVLTQVPDRKRAPSLAEIRKRRSQRK